MTIAPRWEVIETFLRKDRWYVRVKRDGILTTMPRANYIWLRGNPSFQTVPYGYAVHHLDHDPLNDDISNLSIMYKFHHIAYHWKHKYIENKIILDSRYGMPVKKPKIYYRKSRDSFQVAYQIFNEDGRKITKYITNDGQHGSILKTKEQAEKAISKTWPGVKWNE